MAHRKAKDAPKVFETDRKKIRQMVLHAMKRVSEAVGGTLGPGGLNGLIESDFPGIPNKNTKDGVTVFESLGAIDAYEHLIIEQARDAAKRTVAEAGDGIGIFALADFGHPDHHRGLGRIGRAALGLGQARRRFGFRIHAIAVEGFGELHIILAALLLACGDLGLDGLLVRIRVSAVIVGMVLQMMCHESRP